jgi:phosphatidylglycerol:prolipoprotein diacylglycerol transferase
MIYVNIDPIAFSVGNINVAWYGIMVALAVVTVVVWALLAVKRNPRLNYNMVLNVALVGIPSGVIFSRLLHVFEYWDYFSQHPAEIIGGEGLTIWGAVLGAALGIWIYSRFSKISFGHLADVIAPAIILAQAIGRVGCTLNGCCYGVPTDLPWGIVYTDLNSHGFEASQKALSIGMGLHPTQVYELIYNLIVFGILLMLRKRFRPDGSLFLIYLVFYAAWRFGIDFIRDGNPLLFGLHEAQLISIVVLIFAGVQLAWKTRWVKKEEIAVADEPPAEKPAA